MLLFSPLGGLLMEAMIGVVVEIGTTIITIGTTMIMTMTVVVEVAEVVGTCTKVGIQARIASRITLGDSALRITSFIVATIMATSWNATVPTPTAIGGARNVVEERLLH